jgi:hypothetical protein
MDNSPNFLILATPVNLIFRAEHSIGHGFWLYITFIMKKLYNIIGEVEFMLTAGILIVSIFNIWSFHPLSQYGFLDKYEGLLYDKIHDLFINPSSITGIPSITKIGISYSFRKQTIHTLFFEIYKIRGNLGTLSFIETFKLNHRFSMGIIGDLGYEREIIESTGFYSQTYINKSEFLNFYWNLGCLLGMSLNPRTSLGFSFSIFEAPFYSEFNGFPLIPVQFKNGSKSLSLTLGLRRGEIFDGYLDISYSRFFGRYETENPYFNKSYTLITDEISILFTRGYTRFFGSFYMSSYREEFPYYQIRIEERIPTPAVRVGVSVQNLKDNYKSFALFVLNAGEIEKGESIDKFLNFIFSLGGSINIYGDILHLYSSVDVLSKSESVPYMNLPPSHFPVWTFPLINLYESGIHLTVGLKLKLLKYLSFQIGIPDLTDSKWEKKPKWVFLLNMNI